MTKRQIATAVDPEIAAISIVNDALKNLEANSQQRVLDYVAGKLGLNRVELGHHVSRATADTIDLAGAASQRDDRSEKMDSGAEDLEGISPVAIKWMRRNGLTADRLATIFSLGVDDIDLVAKTVPGKNKKERMHSVLLLKGMAAYLGTGVARVSHEQVKEASLHYDAFDNTNFAKYLSSFAAEVSGSKEAGYTLTPRGITVATDLIKSILGGEKDD